MILVNGSPLNVTMFPDKTSQVWKLPSSALHNKLDEEPITLEVEWRFENEAELFHLFQLSYLICPMRRTCLYLPYLPYARQDKEVDNNATFAIHPFSCIINTCNFDFVKILDPHSEVALSLINHSIAVYPLEELKMAIAATEATMVVYPDKGAAEKYTELYKKETKDLIVACGNKTRDPLSGHILDYKIKADVANHKILIVDDLCDAGATFIILSEFLYRQGASEVNLFVTHGLFTKGIDIVRSTGIKRIFTGKGEITWEKSIR